jgi:hypothetical protein
MAGGPPRLSAYALLAHDHPTPPLTVNGEKISVEWKRWRMSTLAWLGDQRRGLVESTRVGPFAFVRPGYRSHDPATCPLCAHARQSLVGTAP